MFRIIVYDGNGLPVAELNKITVCKRSWVLNKYGVAQFVVPLNHKKARREYLAEGNRVVIFSTLGVETWGGEIVALDWDARGITVTAHSMAAVLEGRILEALDYQNATAADIFAGLINHANTIEHTGIVTGALPTGGKTHEMHPRLDSVYKLLDMLHNMTGYDWDVTYSSPTLWYGNLHARKGSDKTDTVNLQWGQDIAGEPKYSEDRTKFANEIIAVGAGDTWDARPKIRVSDPDSIRSLRRTRQAVIEFDDISRIDTLRRRALEELNRRKRPQRKLDFNIQNKRGYFSKITTGDIVAVSIPHYGFTGLVVPVRILAMELDEAAEIMTLSTEIVEPPEAMGLAMYRNAQYGTLPDGVVRTAPPAVNP